MYINILLAVSFCVLLMNMKKIEDSQSLVIITYLIYIVFWYRVWTEAGRPQL